MVYRYMIEPPELFRISDDDELTPERLAWYITRHKNAVSGRYKKLAAAYSGDYQILHTEQKAPWKPDHRLVVNFAKYITDTFEGFFMGVPVRTESTEEGVQDAVETIETRTEQDDTNSALSHICSVYGRAYELMYVTPAGTTETAALTPAEAFAIYNESIKPAIRYFVRTYTDTHETTRGTVSDGSIVRYFHLTTGGEVIVDGEHPHGFASVPVTEYVQNAGRTGVFEPVLSLINAYNKTVSEKANDVDYFSDAYLKILGAEIDEQTMQWMRSNRVINFRGANASDLVVDFLAKPDGDTTQEHLLERLERLIFTVAMVCNISSDTFATTSGIALRYKLLPMINLARVKERKFAAAMRRRYRVMFTNPVSPLRPEAAETLRFRFTQNLPANAEDEANTAAKLTGIVSRKTQLSLLSAVDSVQEELDRIEEEEDRETYRTDYPTNRTTEDDDA